MASTTPEPAASVVIRERYERVKDIPLSVSSHAEPKGDASPGAFCVNEKWSYVTGQPWTDRPPNMCRRISAVTMRINDRCDQETRDRLDAWMFANADALAATADDGLADRRRYFGSDWAIRTVLPMRLDAAKRPEAAARLRGLPEITDAPETRQAWRCTNCGSRATIGPSRKRARDGCTSGRLARGASLMHDETIPADPYHCSCCGTGQIHHNASGDDTRRDALSYWTPCRDIACMLRRDAEFMGVCREDTRRYADHFTSSGTRRMAASTRVNRGQTTPVGDSTASARLAGGPVTLRGAA